MPKIHKLNKETISKISAGEVIERPANVVKELIENAIDAKAHEIIINLEDSGLKKIEVIDDGVGMSEKDLLIATLPYTTSKLKSVEDLSHIYSLGFRGEALNSIRAVSTLTIKTKRKGESKGTMLTIINGKTEIKHLGLNSGTTVEVTNLFKNVPARKKFLKSKAFEVRSIVEIVLDYALSYTNINFRLFHNGKKIIDETSNMLTDRLSNFWGEDIKQNLLPIKETLNFFEIEGYIGKPQISTNSTSKLLIYVNNRRVTDKLITNAVKESFGTLLMARSFPTGIIFIKIPPQFVDVNVHPTKREVRFTSEKEVYDDVFKTIEKVLNDNNLTYKNVNFVGSGGLRTELKEIVSKKKIAQVGKIKNKDIFQAHDSFLIYEVSDGIQIIDQHAAHESLLYFEFLDSYNQKKSQSIKLQKPYLINLTISQELLINEHIDTLKTLGFDLENFGDKTLRVTKAPEVYKDRDIKAVIDTILLSLSENKKNLSEAEHLMLATLACKSAIKAGDYLTLDQRREIVDALKERNYAYTCPHGRPVKLTITLNELSRMFKRK